MSVDEVSLLWESKMGESFKESTNYEVCFVRTSEQSQSESLVNAFEAMNSHQMEPLWIEESDCFKVVRREPKLYVMDPFNTPAFEHLKSASCRIVGPLCILQCLKNEERLPKRPRPLYSVAMRRVTISCSNISNSQREEISQQVELMGGFFSKDLTKSVSHLVVGEVGSKKYQVAASFGLPIMTIEWINSVWSEGQHQQIHAGDSTYDKFRCPVFKGLVITVSQLGAQERAAMQSLVESNGGQYLPPLKAQRTTHLVLTEPSGDKYRYAQTWKIFCVSVDWVHDSLQAGYCKDENLYKVDGSRKRTQPKRSTPNKDTTCDLPIVDCSAINNVSAITHLDETTRSDITLPIVGGPMGSKRNSANSDIAELDGFNLTSLPKNSQFLDGCKIFLTGFSPPHLDKLRRIVNAGGAMRFNKYSDSVSHVVCGDLTDDLSRLLSASLVKPFVINYKWLLECCRNEKMVDEKPFLCVDGLSLLSPDKSVDQAAKKITLPVLPSSNQSSTSSPISDILKQYIDTKSGDSEMEAVKKCPEISNPNSISNGDSNKTLKNVNDEQDISTKNNSKDTLNKTKQNLSLVPNDQMKKSNSAAHHKSKLEEDITNDCDVEDVNLENDAPKELFSGMKFAIVDYGTKDIEILSNMAKSQKGVVVSQGSFKDVVAIVPLVWTPPQNEIDTFSNIVTNCWLQKCIEEGRIFTFDDNELFRPLQLSSDAKPFENFVISVSQYSGTERDCLMHLAEVLGATCQEYFVRRASKAKGILSNTHLICMSADGSKYEASKKWKIPAVSKKWVLDSAKTGVPLPVEKYLIDRVPDVEDDTTKENVDLNNVQNASETIQNICNLQNNMEPQNTHEMDVEAEVEIPVIQIDDCRRSSTPKTQPQVGVDEVKSHKFETPKGTTPLSLRTSTVKKLDLHRTLSSPLSTAETSTNESFHLDRSYKQKFRISGILNDLDSNASPNTSRRQSLPIEELFVKNLAVAVKRAQDEMPSYHEVSMDSDKNDKCDALKDVVLCVSKKLNGIQNELHDIVTSLGGQFVWSFNDSCTHFVFSGKTNDLTKDFRMARSHEKKIVCPEWLYSCRDSLTHIDESLFPHTLKPNMSLVGDLSICKAPVTNSEYPTNTTPLASNCKSVADPKEDVAAYEPTADFNKELNDLLVAAKSAKKRNSRRAQNSASNTPTNASPAEKAPRIISEPFFKEMHRMDEGTTEDQDTGSQQSQSCPIVWDDPTGRREREKIAAMGQLSTSTTSEAESEEDATPRKFMFTNISDAEKRRFSNIIQQLGGEVSEEKAFDMTATHLVVEKPTKNEKLLSSVAAGKWVIHPQFLLSSQEKKAFVSEEEFEWGGINTSELSQKLPPSNRKIAACPHRWRQKISTGRGRVRGAFCDWKVAVYAEDSTKMLTFLKILEAGGAEVIPHEEVETKVKGLSFIIIDMKKKGITQFNISPNVISRVKCVKPEYLGVFLTEESPPSIDNFVIQELSQNTSACETSIKRRNLSRDSTRNSKKSRVS